MEKTTWQLTAALLAACTIGASYAAWQYREQALKSLDPDIEACRVQGETGILNAKCNAWGTQNFRTSVLIKELTDKGFACIQGQLFSRDAAGVWQRAGTCPKYTYD